MPRLYVKVAVALPGQAPYQYSVPEPLENRIAVGERVYVMVRTRRMVGYIVEIGAQPEFDQIRPIESIIDEAPILDGALFELAKWISSYYSCGLGQAIEVMMPAAFKKGKTTMKARQPKSSAVRELVHPEDLPLTPQQQTAYLQALEAMRSGSDRVLLLHGITGSGKTEVYMHLIRDLLREGKSAIVLVPEISLTPQTVDRFESRFGTSITVIHSRLSQARRVEEWHRIRKGLVPVVVGARSAVFSPLPSLGVIVIDEEHDASYKQGETPRYHAREVAIRRAQLQNAMVVLGSATPSLESFYQARTRRFRYAELSERIEKRPLPTVEIVDMRRSPEVKRDPIFSPLLEKAIRESLARGEQVMLLLNRRGFSTYLHCSSCGHVMTCENCRVSLAYHTDKKALVCHTCHYRAATVSLCPSCRKNYLHYFGMGTQRVEEEARKLFPGAAIGRMDADSTAKKDSHETILRAFKRGEIHLLIGTQMIAKGHDFPNVSLIGVISADTALHVPDFRSSERTFDLLTQVAGRAGRGDIPGRVVIQTFVPHHYAIQSAKDHDYREFYEKEIRIREDLGLPPFSHLVRIIFSGASEKDVIRDAMELGKTFDSRGGLLTETRVLGPAPAIVSREKGLFQWNLFLKGPRIEEILRDLSEALRQFKKHRTALTVDVDPQ